MELVNEATNNTCARRFGLSVLLAAGMMLNQPVSHADANPSDSRPHTKGWKLQWKDTFNDGIISDRWKVMDDTSFPWDRFSQYRQFNSDERGGNLILTSRRHCLTPGEDMTLTNAQTEPCAPGETERYSAGRVEQAVKDIEGDFKVTVRVKMPLGKIGTREAIWMNNLQDMGEPNGGYCIEGSSEVEGSSEPNDEKDLVEWYGDRKVRASHHLYCEDGELAEVPRARKIRAKQMKKYNEYTVTRIGNKTEFFVNDRAIPLLQSKKRSFDTPRDFDGVSNAEYWTTRQYLEGMIFCTRAFDEKTENPLFSRPDSSKPFPERSMKIDKISVYTVDQ
jgi:hypothetical protein